MPYTNSSPSIHYEIAGSGRPVVLIHGWPLSARMWEYQIPYLVDLGYCCIAYDRRGFGDSNHPWDGYDYDTLTADLDQLMTELNLRDAALVGFSMGGGEVARYLAKHGNARVSRAVLMSAVTPYLYQSDESPKGVPASMFEEFQKGMFHDRIGFLKQFNKDFFGLSVGSAITELVSGEDRDTPSDALLDYFLQIQAFASPQATRECAKAFGSTNFTEDLKRIQVPTMIMHGDADRTVPFEATAQRAAGLIKGSRLEVVKGGSHGLWYTHRKQVNALLRDFLRA